MTTPITKESMATLRDDLTRLFRSGHDDVSIVMQPDGIRAVASGDVNGTVLWSGSGWGAYVASCKTDRAMRPYLLKLIEKSVQEVAL